MKLSALLILSCVVSFTVLGQEPSILIRCDDIGMCHTVNMAFEKVVTSGLPVSASVLFVCPWYQEAVEILRHHPEIPVGVHLALNAEWKNYRWGPVAGASAVPSLVDSLGYFFGSRERLFANNPPLREIETELRAQILRALHSGLKIEYVDYHMGAAVQSPELRTLLEKLAAEYGLGISRWFGETDLRGAYAVAPEHKLDTLLAQVSGPMPTGVSLAVFHIGLETEEMNALSDLNSFGLSRMSTHRQAELGILLSPAFRDALRKHGVTPVTYRDLIRRMGLSAMVRPTQGLD